MASNTNTATKNKNTKMNQLSEKTKHKLDDAKLTLEGVKDKLFGGVKQTVGHLLRKPDLESQGRAQKTRANEELKHHRGLPELTSAQVSEMHMKREALMADVVRSGGVARMSGRSLRHVETRETSVKELFTWQPFALKRWSIGALLNDIRQCNTMKPLVHVETVEKGLMRSIKLDAKKGDFELRLMRDNWTSLWADIRRGDNVARLSAVKPEDRRDRSAPRLDVLRSVSAAQEMRGEVLRQIAIEHKILKHVETEDKARPELWFAKADASEVNPIGTGLNKEQLLDAVRQGAVELKHVETEDKAKPAIGDCASVRTWNKDGFLSEVRQGTELRHI